MRFQLVHSSVRNHCGIKVSKLDVNVRNMNTASCRAKLGEEMGLGM